MSRARPNAGRRNAAIAAASGVLGGLLFVYPTSLGHAVGAGAAPSVGSVAQPGVTGVSSGSGSSGGSATTRSGSSTGSGAKTGTTSGGTTGGTRTVTGSAVNTRYGPVQVQLTISSGRITSAAAVEYPSGNGRDREINSYAVPELNAEVVAAQSAGIDTVSGATYTSVGYLKSLQSALDAAHLA